jgi:hypothetical protein
MSFVRSCLSLSLRTATEKTTTLDFGSTMGFRLTNIHTYAAIDGRLYQTDKGDAPYPSTTYLQIRWHAPSGCQARSLCPQARIVRRASTPCCASHEAPSAGLDLLAISPVVRRVWKHCKRFRSTRASRFSHNVVQSSSVDINGPNLTFCRHPQQWYDGRTQLHVLCH